MYYIITVNLRLTTCNNVPTVQKEKRKKEEEKKKKKKKKREI